MLPHLAVVNSVLLGLAALFVILCLGCLMQMLTLLHKRLAQCEERLAELSLLLEGASSVGHGKF
jgi:ABC-type Fe3+ transport system permease subunit